MLRLLADTTIQVDGASLITAAGTLGGLVAGAVTLAGRTILAAMAAAEKQATENEKDRRKFEEELVGKIADAVTRLHGLDIESRKQIAQMSSELVRASATIAAAMSANAENTRTLQAKIDALGACFPIERPVANHAAHKKTGRAAEE